MNRYNAHRFMIQQVAQHLVQSTADNDSGRADIIFERLEFFSQL